MKSCAIDKALGLDGFPMSFYLTFWDMVKEDNMSTMQYFHDHRVFERSCNATCVAIIPKKVVAIELRDFRPISLMSEKLWAAVN